MRKRFVCPYNTSVVSYAADKLKKLKTKLRGLSPQANYTDRATAAVGEVVPNFADRGVLRGQRNGSPRPLILSRQAGFNKIASIMTSIALVPSKAVIIIWVPEAT
jgi:hypothetical protein